MFLLAAAAGWERVPSAQLA